MHLGSVDILISKCKTLLSDPYFYIPKAEIHNIYNRIVFDRNINCDFFVLESSQAID